MSRIEQAQWKDRYLSSAWQLVGHGSHTGLQVRDRVARDHPSRFPGTIVLRRRARWLHFQHARLEYFVPTGLLQYSTQLRASSGVPVPRLTVIMGIQSIILDNWINSSVPNWFGSMLCEASSFIIGRDWTSAPLHPANDSQMRNYRPDNALR